MPTSSLPAVMPCPPQDCPSWVCTSIDLRPVYLVAPLGTCARDAFTHKCNLFTHPLTHSHAHTSSLSLSHTHTHTHARTPSLSYIYSLTHTHTLTHTHAPSPFLTLSHSHSHSHTLFLSLPHSCSYPTDSIARRDAARKTAFKSCKKNRGVNKSPFETVVEQGTCMRVCVSVCVCVRERESVCEQVMQEEYVCVSTCMRV
jgi:hypothetical protein